MRTASCNAKAAAECFWAFAEAFVQGEEAIAHMELSNGELRVPRESDAERNWQPARNVLELINVCTSCKEVVEGTEVLAKEIRPVTLKLEVNKDFREWEHYLSKCMRTHGARALDSVARCTRAPARSYRVRRRANRNGAEDCEPHDEAQEPR